MKIINKTTETSTKVASKIGKTWTTVITTALVCVSSYYIGNIVGRIAVKLISKDRKLKMTYRLQKMYRRCRQKLQEDQFIRDKPFKGTMTEFVVLGINTPIKGEKLINRYGEKGVTSEVLDDEMMQMMPMLDNGQRMEGGRK